MIVRNDFNIVKSKEIRWTMEDAQKFYAEHKGTVNHISTCVEMLYISL